MMCFFVMQVDFLVVLYYGEGRYFKILSCFFSCYVHTDLVADEGLPASSWLTEWVFSIKYVWCRLFINH